MKSPAQKIVQSDYQITSSENCTSRFLSNHNPGIGCTFLLLLTLRGRFPTDTFPMHISTDHKIVYISTCYTHSVYISTDHKLVHNFTFIFACYTHLGKPSSNSRRGHLGIALLAFAPPHPHSNGHSGALFSGPI